MFRDQYPSRRIFCSRMPVDAEVFRVKTSVRPSLGHLFRAYGLRANRGWAGGWERVSKIKTNIATRSLLVTQHV
jgi:hypothetical protein